MKRFIILLVAAIGLVACENNMEENEPFADEIATFDIATLDPVELTAALTASFVEEIDGNVHDKRWGWYPLREMLGRASGHYIFYGDGRCWKCTTMTFHPPLHVEFDWSYDAKTGTLNLSDNKVRKVLYYKGDRLILEHQSVLAGDGGICTYRIEYRLRFGEQIRKEKEEFYKKSSKEWREEQQANN